MVRNKIIYMCDLVLKYGFRGKLPGIYSLKIDKISVGNFERGIPFILTGRCARTGDPRMV